MDDCKAGSSKQYTDAATTSADIQPPTHLTDAQSTKIQFLEEELQNLKSMQACRVCLDVISRHVVSTVCWHVLCEVCWMQVLKNKKLCPQCKTIVTPADLRKIYI